MIEQGFDDDYLFPTREELAPLISAGFIAIGPTHKRKARTATALQWTGDNERAIAEFTHYATELHADSGWIYLREDGRLIDTIAPRSWAFYGEDGLLRILRDGEFKSRYEVI